MATQPSPWGARLSTTWYTTPLSGCQDMAPSTLRPMASAIGSSTLGHTMSTMYLDVMAMLWETCVAMAGDVGHDRGVLSNVTWVHQGSSGAAPGHIMFCGAVPTTMIYESTTMLYGINHHDFTVCAVIHPPIAVCTYKPVDVDRRGRDGGQQPPLGVVIRDAKDMVQALAAWKVQGVVV